MSMMLKKGLIKGTERQLVKRFVKHRAKKPPKKKKKRCKLGREKGDITVAVTNLLTFSSKFTLQYMH
jgi:hypothetical protein